MVAVGDSPNGSVADFKWMFLGIATALVVIELVGQPDIRAETVGSKRKRNQRRRRRRK